MIVAIELKSGIANICIFGIVVKKLDQCQKSSPIALPEINKDLKVCIFSPVLPLDLTMNLRIKSNKKSPFYSKEVAEQ